MSTKLSPNLKNLLEISSQALLAEAPNPSTFEMLWSRPLELLLQERNGFFAFESALHVYPSGSTDTLMLLEDCNSDENGWRAEYPELSPEAICFAQDAFANQFVLGPDGVFRLNPETAEVAPHATSLDDWATKILGDYNFETGWELARLWQLSNRPLEPDERLVPKIPFVLGGEYEVENLLALRVEDAMRCLGRLSRKIRDSPDGTSVTVEGWLA